MLIYPSKFFQVYYLIFFVARDWVCLASLGVAAVGVSLLVYAKVSGCCTKGSKVQKTLALHSYNIGISFHLLYYRGTWSTLP